MIVVDSSALLAVFIEEPEKEAFQAVIDGDDRCVVSAVNAHETACILRVRHGRLAAERFWQWLDDNQVEIVPFDHTQVRGGHCVRPLRQRHQFQGPFESGRLRRLCSRRDHECAIAVQGTDFIHTDLQGSGAANV